MVNYVLDASAILRYLDGEEGAGRVAEVIKGHLAGRDRVVVSAVHWGEVAGITCKRYGTEAVNRILSRLSTFGFEIVSATAERAVRSGLIKTRKRIPYADAFGVDLASDSPAHVLLTADFDVAPAAEEVQIEFLPTKRPK